MVTSEGAKRDVWIFLTVLVLFSSIFYALVSSTPDGPKEWGRYVLPFMWCPALAALATKLARDRTLRGPRVGIGTNTLLLDRIRPGNRRMPAPVPIGLASVRRVQPKPV
jgi:hypothetical protein